MEIRDFIILILFLLCIFFFFQLKKYKTKLDLHHRKTNYLEKKNERLEFEQMSDKLNPHLFKNILNSIQSHAYQSYYSINRLSEVLDYVLYKSPNQKVSPRTEIDFIKNLIEINKIKLSPIYDLRTKIHIDEKDAFLEKKVIAPLLMIDLIENAFKHADFHQDEGFISIFIELKDCIFTLQVSNKIAKGSAHKKENSGIGTQNLETRLNQIYGTNYKLSYTKDDFVYGVSLKIYLAKL